jgi:glycosyltransferase involved in cell wall biosynthesis
MADVSGSVLAPQVSVIMPAYNAAAFLREAMHSVLNQTLRDLELIVIDDASSDDTAGIAMSISDPRVVLIRLPSNSGAVGARNAGIDRARGEFIALLDADDVAKPERLATQVALLRASGADVCASNHETWRPSTGRIRRGRQYLRDTDLKALLTVYCPITNSTVTGKARVFKTWRYDPAFAHAEDYELWARVAAHGCVFTASTEVLVTYRLHEGQTSMNHQDQVRMMSEKVRAAYLQHLGVNASLTPRKLPWRERLQVAPRFLKELRKQLGPVSLRAEYEIYARFQYRGNGVMTPLVRLERLLASAWARWS